MIFTGAKLDAGLYNDLLYRQGTRLLPCALKSLVDENIRGLIVEPLRPSPLEKLLELKPSALERVAARQIMAVDEPTDKDRTRPACWPGGTTRAGRRRSSSGSSATAASCSGRPPPTAPATTGRSSPASSWRCARPCAASARPTSMANTVTAGERMRRVVRSNQPVSNVRLNPPGGGEPRSLSAAPVAEDPGDRAPAVAIEVPDTRQPGLYRVSWDEGPLGNQQDAYAANPDPRESNLERIAADRGEVAVRPAGRRDRLGQVRRGRVVLPDRPRDLARPGVCPVRPPDRRVDLRHLGRTLPMRSIFM